MADKYKRISFYDQIARNKRKSVFLIIIIFLVFLVLGYVISLLFDPGFFFIIMIISIIVSIVYILLSYYNSDKIAISSVNAKPASRSQFPQYHNSVEGIAIASGLPKPKLYIMQSPQINAFATGRNPEHAVICVTTGALEKLNKEEFEGVIAHEMSHIANYDIRFMTLTAVMVGLIAIISELFLRSMFYSSFSDSDRDNRATAILIIVGVVLAILAPLITQLVQLAISRKREYTADATAVKFTRYPKGLQSALKKIQNDNTPVKKHQVSKAVAPLFMSDPFRKKITAEELFSTHPPIAKRIAVLERM